MIGQLHPIDGELHQGQPAVRATLFAMAIPMRRRQCGGWAWWLSTFGVVLSCAPGVDEAGSSETDVPTLSIERVRWQLGDDPSWAQPALDDAAWPTADLLDLVGQDGIFWLRTPVQLGPRHADAAVPLGVRVSALASCDLFWDGAPLPGEGRPGPDRDREQAGPIDLLVHLPHARAQEGLHVLAARCSTHHRQIELAGSFQTLAVGFYGAMLQAPLAYAGLAMASLTAKFVAAAFFLSLFVIGRRDRATLDLGLLSLATAGLLIAEAWRPLFGYPYGWHVPRLLLILGLAWLSNALLVRFVFDRFPARGRRGLGIAAAVASMAVLLVEPSFDGRVALFFLLGLGLAFGWCIGALVRAAPDSGLATAGVGLCFVGFAASPFRFLDQGVFLAFDAMLMLLLIAQAAQVRRERDALEAARLRATRLQLELVKKSIQPHFLMNTLTALAEWFERQPERATEGLEALAAEIRLLGALADHRTVPLARELELCHAHLAVMGLRRDCAYQLDAADLDTTAPCPPGIIHTLVENAVTHGPSPDGGSADTPIRVSLTSTLHEGQRRYRLTSPLRAPADPPRDAETSGTGFRYVRARLAEAFGEQFTFQAGPKDDRWIAEWSIPAS